ncbi:cell division protein [Lactobacillus nasalidis]|uniref:Cell division protein n=1 Tax=Lactobacillus nasalidis TaxID=2797258 RepID=A0ABQ3W8P6_9LACO|nr:6-pyruvoyl-tetrahydropterin synthase-related protein [Lactobacillus nasalidis]GHV97714.1 cell division protein [Lactobacillus nasalidis]GHV99627.1 cell division protein [Lactobacillus nasalidis]GHW01725.1 cell division protein [Lactobacillus nasalidis]
METEKNRKTKLDYQAFLPYAALFLLAAYFAFRQMRTGNIIIGSDTIFHYNRFYEAAEQIKHGNFNWFMSLYGYNRSGRVINALYGPLFAYANGLLLLAVGTWYRYQLVSSFIVYLVGGFGMYAALRRFKARRSVATILAMLYLTIGWLPRWQGATNFSGISAAMMPYGILVAADMIFDKEKPIHWVKLGLLMAVALEVHLLTAVMYMAFLLPAWLYAMIKNKGQQKLWLSTCQAVGLAVLLALNTLAPLFWMSKSNHLAAPSTMGMMGNALHLKHTYVAVAPTGLLGYNQRDGLTYWMFYIFLFQLGYAIWQRQKSQINCWLSLYGGFWLLLSSRLVPWDHISNRLPALARYLQFPSRFTCIAYPLLLIGMGMSAEIMLRKSRRWSWLVYGVTGAALVLSTSSMVRYMNAYAWNGYLNNVGHNASSKFGREVTAPGKYKSRRSGRYTVSLTDSRKQALRQTNAATHSKDLHKFLTLTKKPIADYLPVYKQDPKPVINGWAEGYKNRVYWHLQTVKASKSYNKTVLSHKVRKGVKFKALKGGRLRLTWTSTGKKKRLPIVTYAQSKLTVNGKLLAKYRRSRIGAPKVASRKGKNVAVLEFVTPLWMKLLLAISLLSWPGFICASLGVKLRA